MVEIIDVSAQQAANSGWVLTCMILGFLTFIFAAMLIYEKWRWHKMSEPYSKLWSIYRNPKATMGLLARADGTLLIEEFEYIAGFFTPLTKIYNWIMTIPKNYIFHGIPTAIVCDHWDVVHNQDIIEAAAIKIDIHNRRCDSPDYPNLTEKDKIKNSEDIGIMFNEGKLDLSDITLPPFSVVSIDKIIKYFGAVSPAIIESHFQARKEIEGSADEEKWWKRGKTILLICAVFGIIIFIGCVYAGSVVAG